VTTISKTGPFFTKDPAKTFRQNIMVYMDAVAAESEKDVKAQLRVGQGSRYPVSAKVTPARVADHVVGRTHSLSGKRWQVSETTSVNSSGLSKKQAIALMAAGSWLESQVHAFRKTRGRIGRMRKTNEAELLKGIN